MTLPVRDHADGARPRAGDDPTLARLARALAAVWLIYDLCDLALGATARAVGSGGPQVRVLVAQVTLVVTETLLVAGGRREPLALTNALARGVEATAFGLNDFYYAATMFLALAVGANTPRAASRQRRFLLAQTAWIYLATALLKVQPPWLSGGILFARQGYQAARGPWPWPAAYGHCVASLPCNAVLAHLAVAGELTLAVMLAAVALRPARHGRLRMPAICLAVAIHGFACAATNVWFFGASMVLQVCLLLAEPKAMPA